MGREWRFLAPVGARLQAPHSPLPCHAVLGDREGAVGKTQVASRLLRPPAEEQRLLPQRGKKVQMSPCVSGSSQLFQLCLPMPFLTAPPSSMSGSTHLLSCAHPPPLLLGSQASSSAPAAAQTTSPRGPAGVSRLQDAMPALSSCLQGIFTEPATGAAQSEYQVRQWRLPEAERVPPSHDRLGAHGACRRNVALHRAKTDFSWWSKRWLWLLMEELEFREGERGDISEGGVQPVPRS